MRVLDTLLGRSRQKPSHPLHTPLEVECLEDREVLTAVPTLAGTTLNIVGGPGNDRIAVMHNLQTDQLLVFDGGQVTGTFASAAVNLIVVNSGDGNDIVVIEPGVSQDAQIF